ncbi:MAG: hypothetical protein ACD_75C01868G0005 [uncultured bacterium]|nr:MAG: hypothetical protein ACD_75C01868G0005 [uncultured bacterium]
MTYFAADSLADCRLFTGRDEPPQRSISEFRNISPSEIRNGNPRCSIVYAQCPMLCFA